MYGFKAVDGVIHDIGRAPITVRDIDATVSISNAANLRAMSLDEQGYARTPLTPRITGGNAVITLPKDGLYTILTR